MGGAFSPSIAGNGYVLTRMEAEIQPLITVVATMDEFHVCLRKDKSDRFKEIVAVFRNEIHANAFADWLTKSSLPSSTALMTPKGGRA
jgi:hypothetical protein